MTKTQQIINWIILGLTTFAFLAAGIMKLLGTEMEVDGFTKWGYPIWFMYFIGVCEVLGAIGLHIRAVARPAAIGLIVILLGAISTHVYYEEGLIAPIPATVLMLFLFGILYLDVLKSKKINNPPAS